MLKRGWQVLCVMACVGCAGELRDPDRFGFLFREDAGTSTDAGETDAMDASAPAVAAPPPCVTTIFQTSCKNDTCHGAHASQVDLVSAGVEKRIVGKMSNSTGACKNRVLVATDGGDSFLLQKVTQMQPPCGLAMPIGSTLSDTDQTCLRKWIESLANTN